MIAFFALSLWGGLDFSLFAFMYLLPVVYLIGLPVSVISDNILKRLDGVMRGLLALFIHQTFAAIFILTPTLLGWKWDILSLDIQEVFNNFFFISAIFTSSLFWLLDEILRGRLMQEKCRLALKKVGGLRI
ncbi:hypothetical protein ABN702_15630 [Bacillus haimaensis]|uniref:hypothetical protein n=1 Tax=Bacillus haimaensis TaxID=3160967 RepID=UPI003AA7D79B